MLAFAISIAAIMIMFTATTTEVNAATKYAKTISDIDNASEFVLISAKYAPSGKLYALTPDTRAAYKDWATISPYKASTAKSKHQVWYISKYGNVSRGYGYNWENIGTYTIFNKGEYNPSNGSSPNMALTEIPGKGDYWVEEIWTIPEIEPEIVYEHFNDPTQRWKLKKIGTKNGKGIFRFVNCKTGNYLCGGGYEGWYVMIVG